MILLALAIVDAGCGQQSPSAAVAKQTLTPDLIGTATLSEAACDVTIPDTVSPRIVRVGLVNKTKYLGRYILIAIYYGHTVKELVDYWDSGKKPDFVNDISLVDVPMQSSGEMTTPIAAGTYAFHCGYPMGDKAVGFFHGPIEARTT